MTKDKLGILIIENLNINISKKHELLNLFSSSQEIIESYKSMRTKIIQLFGEKVFLRLDEIISKELDLIKFEMLQLKCNFITIEDEDYPLLLKEIHNPPLILYYLGNIKLLNEEIVTVTGTRFSTIYGSDCVDQIVGQLSDNEVIVATGISDGIDAGVIEKSLESQGKIIVVTAGGIDKIVPSINKSLKEKIIVNGLIVSEFPPQQTPRKYHYDARNRIFSGISSVIVVVEADLDSNVLKLAEMAQDYSREVFALPNSIFSRSSKGTNKLILDNVALPLLDTAQILEFLDRDYNFATQTKSEIFTDLERQIVNLLADGKKHLIEISNETDKSIADLMAVLLSLEIRGFVRNIGGNEFTKTTKT